MAKVGDTLKFRDLGPSLEEARKKMLEAGETPKGLLVSVVKEVAKTEPAGTPPVVPVAAPSKVTQKTPTQARLTIINPDGTDGESQLVTANSTFELNSLLQRNHALAQKNKKNIRVELIDPNLVADPERTIEVPEILEVVEQPTVVVEEEKEEPVEVLENNKFRIEIRQEDGEWTAEITYKTGGGVERFTAPSRKALNMKLAEGKAHGTLRVREAIRREKYGVELDQTYTLPDYLTKEAFDALPEPAQQAIVESVAVQETLMFHKLHPEFYITEENSIRMQKFLKNKGLPFTATNFTYAYEELAEADELETRPIQKIESVSVPKPPTQAGDSAAAAKDITPPAPVVTVRKRGTTGLMPAQSSVVTAELETTVTPEAAPKSSEPSEAELRSIPLTELKQRYRATLKPQSRRF